MLKVCFNLKCSDAQQSVAIFHLTTSFRWRHRFLKLAETLNAEALEGIVEADQTLFRESFKGKRKITEQYPRKQGNDKKKETH